MSKKPVKISTVLTRAAKYLESVGWTKGAFFKARNHKPLYPTDAENWPAFVSRAREKGCRACAMGALYIGADGDDQLVNEAADYVSVVVNEPSVPWWNDKGDRTKDEVVQALKDAAKAARKDGK